MFQKVLVANRGEIAVRVIQALRELGIKSVAVYSDADKTALHVQRADEAVRIGPPRVKESYLHMERIVEAALTTGCQAIHPGYGFLSENAAFARLCRERGIKFIGPTPEAIDAMGDKLQARKTAQEIGVPVLPGSRDPVSDFDTAARVAETVGYPVILKAAAGGGGIGMRVVHEPSSLERELASAIRDAEQFFGNGAVYVEMFLERPRHIEVQVLGDEYGKILHLGERECSIQRRNQKLVEESPAPGLSQALRDRVAAHALRLCEAIGYSSAGTLEFLYDGRDEFYFLEMNTRIQVEHPVTESVTGIDLVKEQIRLAAGERLAYDQEQIQWRGHAIECRINAEDPTKGFMPSLGVVTAYNPSLGPGVRLDSGIYTGYQIPPYYDSLLAKLIVWAPTRDEAVHRLRRALHEFELEGINSTLTFHRWLVADSDFIAGRVDTGYAARLIHQRV